MDTSKSWINNQTNILSRYLCGCIYELHSPVGYGQNDNRALPGILGFLERSQ